MVHKPAASPQKSAPRKRASKKDVPPQMPTTPVEQAIGAGLGVPVELVTDDIAQAEYRRDTLQAEAAINLAIGYAISYCGYSFVDISDEALAEFSRKRMVTVEKINGGYRYTVSTRK